MFVKSLVLENCLVSLSMMLLADKTRVKLVNSDIGLGQLLSVSISLLLVKPVPVLFEVKVRPSVLLTPWI